ncbi:MAG TPA: hypothetical protein VMO00_19605 [Methylomirabilota bacterium]|nr:hypothetical protein [Methylomirabilota bacterium]
MTKQRHVTADELPQLERTLRWHFPRLRRELLEGPDAFPDSHLAVAGYLRVLLCDHKYPCVLLRYASAHGKRLLVYTPPIPTSSKKSTVLVAWSALIASWEPVPDFKFVPIELETYLDTPIGVVQCDVNAPNQAYTPRELINWVANTEGVGHFNDPTTAVLALDQLHRLLRYVGQKQLDPGTVCDERGKLRSSTRRRSRKIL